MLPIKHTFTFFGALFLALLAALRGREMPRPIVGAIRWDGWYGDATVGPAVEASLGPPKYHFRLPWFAQVLGDDRVRIHGDSQAIVEKEIAYAAQAGLNYWAFVDYGDEAPGMQKALDHYLTAKNKQGLRYCFVEEGQRLDRFLTGSWLRCAATWSKPRSWPGTGSSRSAWPASGKGLTGS